MIAAIVSGPSSAITWSISASSAVVSCSPCSPSSGRNWFVQETWRTGIAGGPNGSFMPGTPVNDSAPSVTP